MMNATPEVSPPPASAAADRVNPLDRRLVLALGTVLLLVTALVFSQVGGFKLLLWDDQMHLVDNEYFHPVSAAGLLHLWGYSYLSMYNPVAYSFWGCEVAISQWFPSSDPTDHFNPAVFHLGNLLVHLACALLVYRLLLRLVRHAPAAFFGALLFAVHPLQTESVCWVSETRGTLAAIFSLLALHKYLDYVGVDTHRGLFVDRAYEPPQRRRRDYLWATAFFLAALLSKAAAVALPAIVVVVEVLLLRGSWRRSLLRLAPWFVAAAVLAGLTKHYQKDEHVAADSITKWSERPLVIGDTYAFYLTKLAWPANPSFDYGRTPVRAAESPYYRWAWALPTAVLALSALDRKRRRIWLTGFAFFVFTIAPVSGIVPFLYQSISTVADRYVYFALIGFGLILSAGLAVSKTKVGYAFAAVLLTLAALQTFRQTELWRNDYAVFGNGLRVNPQSHVAELLLGHRCRSDGRLDEAVQHYQRLLELRPEMVSIRNLVGLRLLEQWDPLESTCRHASLSIL